MAPRPIQYIGCIVHLVFVCLSPSGNPASRWIGDFWSKSGTLIWSNYGPGFIYGRIQISNFHIQHTVTVYSGGDSRGSVCGCDRGYMTCDKWDMRHDYFYNLSYINFTPDSVYRFQCSSDVCVSPPLATWTTWTGGFWWNSALLKL